MNFNTKTLIRRILPILVCGLLGYVYYYLIGCNNGCPIQINPYASTIYGAVIGAILSFPSRDSKNNSKN